MRLLEELELGSVSGGWGFDDDTPPPGGDEPERDKREPREEPREEPQEKDDKVNTPPEEYCDSGEVAVYVKITKDPSVEGSVGLKLPKIPGVEVEGNLEGGETIVYVECKWLPWNRHSRA